MMTSHNEAESPPVSRQSFWGSGRGAALLASTLATVLLLLAAPVYAGKVIPPTIAELSRECDVIVVAKVEAVLGSPEISPCEAIATVEEVWKGDEDLESVRYTITSKEPYDVSRAKRGETVLLFLNKAKKGPGWSISCLGRGRMLIQKHQNKEYCTFYDINFPKTARIIELPEIKWEGDKGIKLEELRALVNESLRPKK